MIRMAKSPEWRGLSGDNPGIISLARRRGACGEENPLSYEVMSAPFRMTREPLERDSPAFRLALKAWPEAERTAQEEAILAMVPARQNDTLLLAARRGDELLAVVLGQRLAGNAGVIWPPQQSNVPGAGPVAAEALSALEQLLLESGTHLCQALLAKDDAAGPARLHAAGYLHAANLLYLTCEAKHFPASAPQFPGLVLRHLQPGEEEQLAGLIDETYVGTRDCPVLNGMRSTLDVLEGYKGVGRFRPEQWLILARTSDGENAGCLILAEHPQQTMELIYVGITPGFRRRRLGELLTRHAQFVSRQAACERLVLAVDAANEPAIAMYTAAGFWVWDERACWVKSLRPAAATRF
jgi:ribosomal protein S18 acetylase RimI-like enzyme